MSYEPYPPPGGQQPEQPPGPPPGPAPAPAPAQPPAPGQPYQQPPPSPPPLPQAPYGGQSPYQQPPPPSPYQQPQYPQHQQAPQYPQAQYPHQQQHPPHQQPYPPPPGNSAASAASAKSTSRTGVAIAAAVAVLAAAGGAWFAFGPGSDGDGGGQSLAVHPDTPGGLLWSVDEGDPDRGMVQGMWLLEDALVKAGLNTVTSYDLADGAVKWSIDLEGEHLCVPTTAAADGRVVVGHGENNCGQNITMIDLNSGKQGWSRRLEPQDTPVDFEIAISGTSYAIHTFGGWNLHRIDDGEVIHAARSAYDARKQAVRYIPYGQEPLQIEDGKEICAADGIAGGEILLRRLSCATVVNAAGGSVSDPVFKLQRIDPDDGEVLWNIELPPGKWLDKVHSVDPVVVTFRSSQFEQITDLVYVTDGEITAQFPIEEIGVAKQDAYQVRENLCRGRIVAYNPLDDCGGMAVHDGLLFVTPPGRNNQITALDATTGAFVWAHKTDDFVGQQVVGADEDGVIVFQRGYSGEPSQVVRLSADGEQAEPLFQLGGDHAVYGDYFVHFRDGVLYVSAPDYSLEHDIAAFSADGTTEPAAEGAEGTEHTEGTESDE